MASSRSKRSGTSARSAHVSRRQAQEAHARLAAEGLSHQERRRLHAVVQAREESARLWRQRLKHLAIVAACAIAVMAIVGAVSGLPSAVDAAMGKGVTGSFTLSRSVCVHKGPCEWLGTFQPRDGSAASNLAYGGTLPAADGPGSVVAARYPGGSYVYAVRGTHTWVLDLLLMLLVGAIVGFFVWLSPLGTGYRNKESQA